MVADAVGLLDVFDLGSAHLVGRSMGEGIAMLAALDHPDRVASLTLVGTSPGGSDLPPMSEEFLAHISGAPDWSDREAVIHHVPGMLRVFSGGSGHLDEGAMRDLVGRDVDRIVNIASSQTNHFVMNVDDPGRERLGEIGARPSWFMALRNPVFPHGYALVLEKELPGARLLALEQTGRELPRAVGGVVPPSCGTRRAASDATRNHHPTTTPERKRNEPSAGSVPRRAAGCSCTGR
jgi:pimeloyl-ACP methyl ester carboxylesterase